MITWTNLLAIARAEISESTAEISDADILSLMNGVLLSVYGDLLVVADPAAITAVTGTSIYDVPANFLYIQGIWGASGNLLPDYAWEVRAGGGATNPKIIFGVGITPTSGQNPVVTGWQARTVQPTGKTSTTDWIALATTGTDTIRVDPGWLKAALMLALHSSLGGTASDLADWHKMQASDSRELQKVMLEMRSQLAPTIPPAYRPLPGARLVPGRGE